MKAEVMADLYNKLHVYQERLFALQCAPEDKCGYIKTQINWYQHQIWEIEAEIAVEDLKYEMNLTKHEPSTVTTDCWETVDMLCKEERVTDIDIKWSWKSFKFMIVVKFYYKKR